MNYSIPKALTHPRYGVTHYHNPELLVALDAISPEMRLHDLILDALFDRSNSKRWEGTSSDLETELAREKGQGWRDISPNNVTTGRYLNRLGEKMNRPHIRIRVACGKRTASKRSYEITLKGE